MIFKLFHYPKSNTNKGFALLLSVVIAGVLAAVGLVLASITFKQITITTSARSSETAFQISQAALECVRSLRFSEQDAVLNKHDISLSCIDATASESAFIIPGNPNTYVYRFNSLSSGDDWGERCFDVDLYILDARNSVVGYNFGDDRAGIGDGGNKECRSGDVCTVAIARGYNVPCDEISGSMRAIQRELTAEF